VTHAPRHGDIYGAFDFVLQACDSGGACTHQRFSSSLAAVNDAPQVPALTAVETTGSEPVEATITGTDERDVDEPGYPSGAGALAGMKVCSVPPASKGVLYWRDGSGWSPVTTGVLLSSTRLRFVPAADAYGTSTVTYKAVDRGHPGQAWSGGGDSCSSGSPAV